MKGINVREYKALFNEHTELRAQRNLSCVVKLTNGKGDYARITDTGGVFARVYKGGVYGASSAAGFSTEGVKRVLREAERLAREGSMRHDGTALALPRLENATLELASEPRALDAALHVELARRIDEHIATHYPKLYGRAVRVRSESMEKELAVSSGTDAHTNLVRAYADIDLRLEGDNGIVELGDYYGHSCYAEESFASLDWIYERIEEQYRLLCDYAHATAPKAGECDVVLSPQLSGMLAHEAVGHTVEADMVQAGSIAAFLMDKPVASPLVTLVDYASRVPGGTAPCNILVDDEGSPATDCVLIENGVLRSFLNSRETAELYGGRACGCARANDYSDEPLIRMRNTAIAPGRDKLEDMIASVEDGYYLLGNMNGQGDTNAEFVIVSSIGYEIKHGKLCRPVMGTSLSGMAFELLKSVSMVGDTQAWRFGGICGKKQSIAVAMGGPAIKCRAYIAGK